MARTKQTARKTVATHKTPIERTRNEQLEINNQRLLTAYYRLKAKYDEVVARLATTEMANVVFGEQLRNTTAELEAYERMVIMHCDAIISHSKRPIKNE